jgi:hypothetical protein
MNNDPVAGPSEDSSGDVVYPTYFHLLADIHRRFRPARYLEIGVDQGHSLGLVRPQTRIVGVDPEPRVTALDHPDWTVVAATSEEFFKSHDVSGLLGGPVDLAFVDGLHHFEVAMADVLAIEPHAHPATVVLVHDVLPIDAATSTRTRTTAVWSGDVWKAVVLLREHRPDLTITTLDVEPTGMAVITGFGDRPSTSAAHDDLWVGKAVSKMMSVTFDDLQAMGQITALGLAPGTPRSLERCLPVAWGAPDIST